MTKKDKKIIEQKESETKLKTKSIKPTPILNQPKTNILGVTTNDDNEGKTEFTSSATPILNQPKTNIIEVTNNDDNKGQTEFTPSARPFKVSFTRVAKDDINDFLVVNHENNKSKKITASDKEEAWEQIYSFFMQFNQEYEKYTGNPCVYVLKKLKNFIASTETKDGQVIACIGVRNLLNPEASNVYKEFLFTLKYNH